MSGKLNISLEYSSATLVKHLRSTFTCIHMFNINSTNEKDDRHGEV